MSTLLALVALMGCGPSRDVAAGEAALARGELDVAEARFKAAIEVAPEDGAALYGLAWTLHLAGRTELARATFERCVDLHPERVDCLRGLGSAAMAAGNLAVARRRLEEAASRAPDDPSVAQSLALLDLRGGDAARALARLDALAERPAEVELVRAECLRALQRYEEAIAAADAAARGSSGRVYAMARVTRARALHAGAAGRVDPADCAATAPPVREWLSRANASLDEAEATGVDIPGLHELRRDVRRATDRVRDACPSAPG